MLIQLKQPRIEKKILAVLPSSNVILQKMLSGFISALGQEKRLLYHLEMITGKEDKYDLEEKVRRGLDENASFDFIFSTGMAATRIVHDINKEKRLQIPQIFCAAPVGTLKGLNHKTKNRGTIGITGPIRDYSLQIHHLLHVLATRPKKVVVLSTNTVIQEEVVSLTNELTKHGIETMEIKIENLRNHPFKPLLDISRDTIDLILVPRDAFFMGIMRELAEFCNYKKIPLYTSDIDSVLCGAAFGFGSPEELHGKMAAAKILPYMLGQQPQDHPITYYNNHDSSFFMLNIEGMEKQGLKLRFTSDEIRTNNLAVVIPRTLYQ